MQVYNAEYPPRMTESEFVDKQNKMLSNIPASFHSWLCSRAWDSGHAYGYEEVISHLSDLLDGFDKALKDYDKAIMKAKE